MELVRPPPRHKEKLPGSWVEESFITLINPLAFLLLMKENPLNCSLYSINRYFNLMGWEI
jgi:hypothetical protein